MSQLTPFVRAFRALGDALAVEVQSLIDTAKGEIAGDGAASMSITSAQTLLSLSTSLKVAATDLEQQIAADLSMMGRVQRGVGVEPTPQGPIVPVDSAWQPEEPQSLGSLNPNNGELLSTQGWVSRGRVWVTKEQADRADYCGWRMTGKVKDFQGSPLYEVER